MEKTREVLWSTESSGQLWNSCLWDLHSGSVEHTFKGGVSAARSLCLVRGDILMSAEHDKPLLHHWVLCRKDSKQNRIVLPGKVSAAVVTQDGYYYIAAISQKIHVWQLSSGKLLAIVSAHYQPIRCLCVTVDGSRLLTAGDDGIVHCWSLCSLVDKTRSVPQDTPLWSSSNHSLPVTDLCVGSVGSKSRVVSVSMDQTCRVYDISTSQQIATFIFDSGLSKVIMNTAQSTLYIGSQTGSIHKISMYAAASKAEFHTTSQADKHSLVFTGHSKEVTCLALSLDGSVLASGSKDMSVRLWHTSSGQCVKTIPHKGSITNLLITAYPNQLNSEKPQPRVYMKQLDRHLHTNTDTWDGKIELTTPSTVSQEEQDMAFCREQASSLYQLTSSDRQLFAATGQLQETNSVLPAEKLEAELRRTQAKLSDALSANKELFEFVLSDQCGNISKAGVTVKRTNKS